MTDFTFTRPLNIGVQESGLIQCRILVAGKSDCKVGCDGCNPGVLYSHELSLVNEERESNKAGAMHVDEAQNNEIFLTH